VSRDSFLFEALASTMSDRLFRNMNRMPREVYYKVLGDLALHCL
jgi:hypothetical protein